jgi:hypothetical protein
VIHQGGCGAEEAEAAEAEEVEEAEIVEEVERARLLRQSLDCQGPDRKKISSLLLLHSYVLYSTWCTSSN